MVVSVEICFPSNEIFDTEKFTPLADMDFLPAKGNFIWIQYFWVLFYIDNEFMCKISEKFVC